jgi:protein PhnA
MNADSANGAASADETEPRLPPCPECASEYAYEQGALLVCPMCGHEWAAGEADAAADDAAHGERVVRDAVGNVLSDGDTVTLVKSVKVSGGGGGAIKVGTKVTGIRLITDGVGDHDIDARVPGFGKLQLKSSVVKRVS